MEFCNQVKSVNVYPIVVYMALGIWKSHLSQIKLQDRCKESFIPWNLETLISFFNTFIQNTPMYFFKYSDYKHMYVLICKRIEF